MFAQLTLPRTFVCASPCSKGFGNTWEMLQQAAKSRFDVIVTGDSDLVFHPLWYARLVTHMPKTGTWICLPQLWSLYCAIPL